MLIKDFKPSRLCLQADREKQLECTIARAMDLTRAELFELLGIPDQPCAVQAGKMLLVISMPEDPIAIYRISAVGSTLPEHTLPSVTTMAGNLAGAVVRTATRALTGAQVMVSDEVHEQRLAVCKACEHYKDGRCTDIRRSDGSTATGCGCNLVAKTKLASEKCPYDKWAAVE